MSKFKLKNKRRVKVIVIVTVTVKVGVEVRVIGPDAFLRPRRIYVPNPGAHCMTGHRYAALPCNGSEKCCQFILLMA